MMDEENEVTESSTPSVPVEVRNELMAQVEPEGAELLGPDGLLSQVTKAVLERALDVVLFVSTELTEYSKLCHRVVVFYRGQVAGEVAGRHATPSLLLHAINTGIVDQPA